VLAFVALGGRDLKALGIPTVEEYVSEYVRRMSIAPIDNWNFYVAYTFFRFAAIAQGVYKRFTLGKTLSGRCSNVDVTGSCQAG
jgi:aminoglycoside phosphotransferase (APT) family kinase protein